MVVAGASRLAAAVGLRFGRLVRLPRVEPRLRRVTQDDGGDEDAETDDESHVLQDGVVRARRRVGADVRDEQCRPRGEGHRPDAGGQPLPVGEPLQRRVDRDGVDDTDAERAQRVEQIELPDLRRIRQQVVRAARQCRGTERQEPRAVFVAPPADGELRPRLDDDEEGEHQAELRERDVEIRRHRSLDGRPDVLVGADDGHRQRGGDDQPPPREAQLLAGPRAVVGAVRLAPVGRRPSVAGHQ